MNRCLLAVSFFLLASLSPGSSAMGQDKNPFDDPPPNKLEPLREPAGEKELQVAQDLGLKFLARMQDPSGKWALEAASVVIGDQLKPDRKAAIPDRGQAPNDAGGTALGLLPFLGAGKTHKAGKDNPYAKNVEKGLHFLLRGQDKKTGSFGSNTMYAHGLATLAVCEAYGLTKDPALKQPAQQAINFIVKAQHAKGGWRYQPGQPGDTCVTGCQVLALRTGKWAGLDVPEQTLKNVSAFLDSVCDAKTDGYGYVGPSPTVSMTAMGLMCRMHLEGWGPATPRFLKGVQTLQPNVSVRRPPHADVAVSHDTASRRPPGPLVAQCRKVTPHICCDAAEGESWQATYCGRVFGTRRTGSGAA